MSPRILIALVFMAAVGCSPASKPRTEVMVIATMHGAHERSTTYSYDILYHRIRDFAPTAIGVEIRAEDLNSPVPYLRQYYPREMIELAKQFASIARGLDWLGPSIEGRPIPDNYFENLQVKKLERELDANTAMAAPALDAIQNQQKNSCRTLRLRA